MVGWGTLLAHLGAPHGPFIHALVILFFVAGAWANFLKIEFGPVSVNQAFAVELLAVLILDPVRAAWLGALTYLVGTGLPQRHSLSRNLANSAIIGLSVLAMGYVYQGLGGYTYNLRPQPSLSGLFVVLLASLAHFTVNSLLVYSILLMRPGAPSLRVIGRTVQWDVLAKFVFAPLAWYIFIAYHPATPLNLVAPMLFILGIWLLLKNTMELNQTKSDLGRNISILEQLHNFAREAFASLDLGEVLATALRRCTPLAGAVTGAVYLLDPATREPYAGHDGNGGPDWTAYLTSPEMEDLVGALCHPEWPLPEGVRARRGGYWLATSDPSARALGVRQLLALPLFDGSQVAGVLVLGLPGDEEPEETALQTLAIICMEVTQAISNARLHDAVKREWEKRQEELALAEKIQKRNLPLPVDLPGVKVACHFRPARSVGGDYFDLIPMEGNRLAVVIGDVSGKGIPAALTMMSVINRVKVWTNHFRSPDRVLEMLNESLTEPHRSFDEVLQYSTAVFGVLDLTSRKFTYSMAGHERPLLLHAAAPYAVPLEGEGYPLGLFAESTYSARAIQLSPGDRLIFFTDGITDMQNREGLRLSRDTFKEMVEAVHARQPEHFARELIHDLQEFAGVTDNLVDDQALVILEITDELPPPDRPQPGQQHELQHGGLQPAVF